MAASDDKGFPMVNLTNDGWSTEDEATATCFCGAVQLVLVSIIMLKLPWDTATPYCLRFRLDREF